MTKLHLKTPTPPTPLGQALKGEADIQPTIIQPIKQV